MNKLPINEVELANVVKDLIGIVDKLEDRLRIVELQLSIVIETKKKDERKNEN